MADVPSRRRPRHGMSWGAAKAAPHKLVDPPRRILVATPGQPLGPDVIRRVFEIADPQGAKITVVGVARIHGTSLGFPHPGLQPNRVELAEMRTIIEDAAHSLRRPGFEVRVAMSKSRNAPKMIARWGTSKRFHAIVVPDPERPRWRRMIEGDLAHEIHRRCGIPVHAVLVPSHWPARSA